MASQLPQPIRQALLSIVAPGCLPVLLGLAGGGERAALLARLEPEALTRIKQANIFGLRVEVGYYPSGAVVRVAVAAAQEALKPKSIVARVLAKLTNKVETREMQWFYVYLNLTNRDHTAFLRQLARQEFLAVHLCDVKASCLFSVDVNYRRETRERIAQISNEVAAYNAHLDSWDFSASAGAMEQELPLDSGAPSLHNTHRRRSQTGLK